MLTIIHCFGAFIILFSLARVPWTYEACPRTRGSYPQAYLGLDRRKNADRPAPLVDLHVKPILVVGLGDSLLVDLQEVVEYEIVLEPLAQEAERLRNPLIIIINEGHSCPSGSLFVRLEPNLLQMSRVAAFLPTKHLLRGSLFLFIIHL